MIKGNNLTWGINQGEKNQGEKKEWCEERKQMKSFYGNREIQQVFVF